MLPKRCLLARQPHASGAAMWLTPWRPLPRTASRMSAGLSSLPNHCPLDTCAPGTAFAPMSADLSMLPEHCVKETHAEKVVVLLGVSSMLLQLVSSAGPMVASCAIGEVP